MKIFNQNMVSRRCKMMVPSVLEKLDIKFKSIELGEGFFTEPISKPLKKQLKIELHKSGLELMDDKIAIMIEMIINIIVELVHYSEELPKTNFSDYLEEQMHQGYRKMADLFCKTKGITIEHFMILHKVERVKELITYEEMNLTEISYKLHYSSVQHLSTQFKQVTGLTPTCFKSLSIKNRHDLEDL